MAGTDGQAPRVLEFYERLRQAPYKYDFLVALRRFECLHADRPRIGESSLPKEDPIRFCQVPTLRFEPATINQLVTNRDGPPRLDITFFGLFGPNGPLPLHLTDYARDRMRRAKDHTFHRFADIFHHRMLSILYRSWAVAQPTVSFDRPKSDRFGAFVGSLFGIGGPELLGRDAMPDLAKLHFAGLLAAQTKNREGLESILSSFFEIAVQIEQFVGHWMHLPESCRWHLGTEQTIGVLGQSAVAGANIWDRQYKFRIILGPLDYKDFQRFLPTGESLKRLVAFVRNYCGDELLWDLNLLLKHDQIPRFELGRSGQLGWNTWCASQPIDHVVGDLCLAPERHGELGRQ